MFPGGLRANLRPPHGVFEEVFHEKRERWGYVASPWRVAKGRRTPRGSNTMRGNPAGERHLMIFQGGCGRHEGHASTVDGVAGCRGARFTLSVQDRTWRSPRPLRASRSSGKELTDRVSTSRPRAARPAGPRGQGSSLGLVRLLDGCPRSRGFRYSLPRTFPSRRPLESVSWRLPSIRNRSTESVHRLSLHE